MFFLKKFLFQSLPIFTWRAPECALDVAAQVGEGGEAEVGGDVGERFVAVGQLAGYLVDGEPLNPVGRIVAAGSHASLAQILGRDAQERRIVFHAALFLVAPFLQIGHEALQQPGGLADALGRLSCRAGVDVVHIHREQLYASAKRVGIVAVVGMTKPLADGVDVAPAALRVSLGNMQHKALTGIGNDRPLLRPQPFRHEQSREPETFRRADVCQLAAAGLHHEVAFRDGKLPPHCRKAGGSVQAERAEHMALLLAGGQVGEVAERNEFAGFYFHGSQF